MPQSREKCSATEPTDALSDERNNNFNFLRLLFASVVLVSHAVEIADGNRGRELLTRAFGTISFGELAVDGFFLLSGYLIVKSWKRRPELTDFLSKRIRRIYPGYLVAFFLSLCVFAPLGASSFKGYFSELHVLAQVKNALLLRFPEHPVIFAGKPYPVINGSMWSIAFEFRCYLLVVLVGLLGASRQKAVWVTLFVVSLVLTARPAILSHIAFPGYSFLVINPEVLAKLLSFFSAGACLHLFRNRMVFTGRYAVVAAAVLVACMFRESTALLAIPTCGAYLLFWAAFTDFPRLNFFKKSFDISYGVYLYGWPIQRLLAWYFPAASPWALLPPAFLLCCLAGYGSWRLVEAPCLQRRPESLARQ